MNTTKESQETLNVSNNNSIIYTVVAYFSDGWEIDTLKSFASKEEAEKYAQTLLPEEEDGGHYYDIFENELVKSICMGTGV
jgi:arsenate reductase-like glutaredoxin family protein